MAPDAALVALAAGPPSLRDIDVKWPSLRFLSLPAAADGGAFPAHFSTGDIFNTSMRAGFEVLLISSFAC